MHNIHRTLNYIERKKKQKQIIKQVLCGAYLNNGNSSKNQEKIVICQHLKYIGQIGCLTHKQLIEKKKRIKTKIKRQQRYYYYLSKEK